MAIKYELDTIPVIDAFKTDCECALCFLFNKAENRYLEFYMGNSIMIPEQRSIVNEEGFCGQHFKQMLLSRKTPHGLGLMAHTHLWETDKNLFKFLDHLDNNLGKEKNRAKSLDNLVSYLKNHVQKCLVCEKTEDCMRRYAYTLVVLWKKQEDFRQLFESSRGICLKHLPVVFEMAAEHLNNNDASAFMKSLILMTKKNNTRLEEEILWYTKKFDFQNNDKPWGTSKDALERTITKLEGVYLEKAT